MNNITNMYKFSESDKLASNSKYYKCADSTLLKSLEPCRFVLVFFAILDRFDSCS